MRTARIVMRHTLTGECRETGTGFNWSALWLDPFWAMANRLWLLAFLMMSAGLAIGLIDIGDEDVFWTVPRADASMMLLYALIFSRFAHAWHRFSGYSGAGTGLKRSRTKPNRFANLSFHSLTPCCASLLKPPGKEYNKLHSDHQLALF